MAEDSGIDARRQQHAMSPELALIDPDLARLEPSEPALAVQTLDRLERRGETVLSTSGRLPRPRPRAAATGDGREARVPDLWRVVDDLNRLSEFDRSDVRRSDCRPGRSVAREWPPESAAQREPAAVPVGASMQTFVRRDEAMPPAERRRYRGDRRRVIVAVTLPLLFGAGVLLPRTMHGRATDPHVSKTLARAATGARARVTKRVTTLYATTAKHAATGADPAARGAEARSAPSRAIAQRAMRGPQAFAWVPAPKATYYRVRFFRGSTEVFEAHPVRARMLLPARWRFAGRVHTLERGMYHWVVQPALGPRRARRYGKAIVAAEWFAGPKR